MKKYILQCIGLLTCLPLYGQVTTETEAVVTHNYNWRYYNYEGNYLQAMVDVQPARGNWTFNMWSNFGLEWQTNLLELSPSSTYNLELNDQNSLALGGILYLSSAEISNSVVVDARNNSGEFYLEYYFEGNSSLYAGLFWNPLSLGATRQNGNGVDLGQLYLGLAADLPLFRLACRPLEGVATIGLQYDDELYSNGVSDVSVGLRYTVETRRNVSFFLLSRAVALPFDGVILFQNQLGISF